MKVRSTTRTRERRAREHVKRRGEILIAAREVFARRGYQAATLDEIAQKAAFAKGTLYNYFRSKQDLFEHIMEILLEEMHLLAASVSRDPGSSREKFHRFASGMMEYYKANEDIMRIVAMEMNRLQLEEERRLRSVLLRVRKVALTLGHALKDDMQKGRVVTDDPLELAQVFIALIHSRTMRRTFEQGGLRAMDARRDADFLTRLFFDGIALP
jgi:AcrR family transcriptional regulator